MHVAAVVEAGGPVRGPLLVHVEVAPLVWDRRGEENGGPEPDQAVDEDVRRLLRQVLCDLEGDDELERPRQVERKPQIVRFERVAGNLEQVGVHVVAVDPEDVGDAVVAEGSEPGAEAAADVDDAAGGNEREGHRDDHAR